MWATVATGYFAFDVTRTRRARTLAAENSNADVAARDSNQITVIEPSITFWLYTFWQRKSSAELESELRKFASDITQGPSKPHSPEENRGTGHAFCRMCSAVYEHEFVTYFK